MYHHHFRLLCCAIFFAVGVSAFAQKGLVPEVTHTPADGLWPGNQTATKSFRFRVIDDFLKNDSEAEAATFSWGKNAGESAEMDIDADLVLRTPDLPFHTSYLPGLFEEVTLDFGHSITRNESAEKEEERANRTKSFIALHGQNHRNEGVFRDLYFGYQYDRDRKMDSSKGSLLWEYQPFNNKSDDDESLASGTEDEEALRTERARQLEKGKIQIVSPKRNRFFGRPRLGVEAVIDQKNAKPTKFGTDEVSLDNGLALAQAYNKRLGDHVLYYGAQLKYDLLGGGKEPDQDNFNVELVYDFTFRHEWESMERARFLQTASLKFNLPSDDHDAFSLQFMYKKGEEPISFEDVERFEIGIGIQL